VVRSAVGETIPTTDGHRSAIRRCCRKAPDSLTRCIRTPVALRIGNEIRCPQRNSPGRRRNVRKFRTVAPITGAENECLPIRLIPARRGHKAAQHVAAGDLRRSLQMNRPHFPIAERTGLGDGSIWNATAHHQPLLSSASAGNISGTALENLRRLMATNVPLSADRVSELRDRVASGAYLTRNAAEITASRMLDDNFDLD